MTIGERIKQRRLELKLSADEVAERLGKNRATIYRYENSDIENLPTTVLEPLAKILETTPAYLMGWEKEIDATISKELQISQEALYSINKFSRTIDISTGHSMMDLFNAMVIHKNFEKIIEEMLLYISRSDDDWEKMVKYFNNHEIIKSANTASMKEICCANMIKNFEELLIDVLNSNVDTFNDVKRDENGNLIISAKPQNEYFIFNNTDNLSRNRKNKAESEEKTLTEVPRRMKEDSNYVNAAHADDYANAPEELKQLEEDIMDDENF